MAKLQAIKYNLGIELRSRIKTITSKVDHNALAAQGDPHSCITIAVCNKFYGDGLGTYMTKMGLGIMWGPVAAAWEPTTRAGLAAKETVKTMIAAIGNDEATTATGEFSEHLNRRGGNRIDADVSVRWNLIYNASTNKVIVLCFGTVVKNGNERRALVMITATVSKDGVPHRMNLRRLPYSGEDVEYEETEEDDGWCFLSTACIRARGLSDNCYELETLRAFRDGYVAAQPGGSALIAEYYSTAPDLVAALGAQPDAAGIYEGLYRDVVKASVRLIDEGQPEGAMALYRRSFEKLRARFGPDPQP